MFINLWVFLLLEIVSILMFVNYPRCKRYRSPYQCNFTRTQAKLNSLEGQIVVNHLKLIWNMVSAAEKSFVYLIPYPRHPNTPWALVFSACFGGPNTKPQQDVWMSRVWIALKAQKKKGFVLDEQIPLVSTPHPILAWWWFQIFFIFTPIWGRFPIWLIFFKWVETTNQLVTNEVL